MCGWKYLEEKGFGPFRPGTEFAALPQDFKCPNCKAGKAAFKPITVTIAGFSDNRQYGFGGACAWVLCGGCSIVMRVLCRMYVKPNP